MNLYNPENLRYAHRYSDETIQIYRSWSYMKIRLNENPKEIFMLTCIYTNESITWSSGSLKHLRKQLRGLL